MQCKDVEIVIEVGYMPTLFRQMADTDFNDDAK